jgi:hypothetical protein
MNNDIIISALIGAVLGYFCGIAVSNGSNRWAVYTIVPLFAILATATVIFFSFEEPEPIDPLLANVLTESAYRSLSNSLTLSTEDKIASSLGRACALAVYGGVAFLIVSSWVSGSTKKEKSDETAA